MIEPRDLPLLPVFVSVVSTGSFTAAAKQLGLAKSVVSHHVRTLEERCAVRLLERTTRRLRLTQVGEHVFDAAREVLGSVRALERVVEDQRAQPTGTLRVTLPLDPSVSALVAPIAAELTGKYSRLKVELVFDDAARDLVGDGFDMAVRLGPLSNSSHVMRRLGSEPEIVVARPELAERYALEDEPERLLGVPWIVHSALGSRAARTLVTRRGDKVQIVLNPIATTNTVVAVRDLLLAGAGFAILPQHVVREDLQSERLRQVCPSWFHRVIWLHALLPTRHGPPRVRAFLSALTDRARALGFEPSGSEPLREPSSGPRHRGKT